jgi:hypothetical protein
MIMVKTERRFFERIDADLAVRYSPYGSDKEYCTTSKNISGGGIRISLLKKLEPGTLLDLELFKYNSPVKTRCRGRIAWMWNEPSDHNNRYFEAGIEFIDNHFVSINKLTEAL